MYFSCIIFGLSYCHPLDRYDHQPDDDHTDTITGLTSCQRMKLYASSSLDGTIRIWDETNNLIRWGNWAKQSDFYIYLHALITKKKQNKVIFAYTCQQIQKYTSPWIFKKLTVLKIWSPQFYMNPHTVSQLNFEINCKLPCACTIPQSN